MLVLYLFFALLLALALYFPVSEEFVDFAMLCRNFLGWTILMEGAWIVIASIIQSASSRVLCLQPMLMTLLRVAVFLLLSSALDILNRVIAHGLSFAGGL